jgi:hypothetical protein
MRQHGVKAKSNAPGKWTGVKSPTCPRGQSICLASSDAGSGAAPDMERGSGIGIFV